jgi:hypothetical protein
MTDSVLQRLAREFQIEEDPENIVPEVANAPSNLGNPLDNEILLIMTRHGKTQAYYVPDPR